MLSRALRDVIPRSASCAGLLAAFILLVGASYTDTAAENRLADIRARGTLGCGIWPEVPGFASKRDGLYAGFDIDTCRAVAAAIFGDATKVDFVRLAHVAEFADREDVDLAVRRLTWTLSRERATGMIFGPVTFHDGQGFLVTKDSAIRHASELRGERICVINVEEHPRTLYRYSREYDRDLRLLLVESDEAAEAALIRGECRAYSADISWLAAARSRFVDGLARYDILPDRISKEPLAPLMRAEDIELARLVRWTIVAMIEAEELGLSSHNIDRARPEAARVEDFLRVHPGSAVVPGPGSWVRAIIAGVGNYGEVYDRNLGADSDIRLDRGPNRLWSDGGLVYAPPLDR